MRARPNGLDGSKMVGPGMSFGLLLGNTEGA